MKKTTLVIMAAGIGSRYGAGIKQLQKVGCCDEIIMDFSIYDAQKAGFNSIVFIIRKDIEKEFKEVIGDRISKQIEVKYVFQETDKLPEGYGKIEGRTKPLGTGHALWCCKDVVDGPFAVINADDYYGREGFMKLHDYLVSEEAGDGRYCMAGFVLKNTLSDNGTVTRGICHRDDGGMLSSCVETFSLIADGDEVSGKNLAGEPLRVPFDNIVSMNMWGLMPDFFDTLDTEFKKFLDKLGASEDAAKLKMEFLLPDIIGGNIKEGKATVKVLDTNDVWYGITYETDKDKVAGALQDLTKSGFYPMPLFEEKA